LFKFTNGEGTPENYRFEKESFLFVPEKHRNYTAFYFTSSGKLVFSNEPGVWQK
jgi:hypothetical protein